MSKFDKVVVCTYSQNNNVLYNLGIKNLPKYRYELIEKILVKLPGKYLNKSFIVMDGKFACIDPYLGTKYHLLSDVKYSKIEILKSRFPKFKSKMKNFINKEVDYEMRNSSFKKFIKNSSKYLPFLNNAKFVGSFKVVRTLSLNKKSRDYDERLTYFKVHSNKILSILAGKWNTSVFVAKKIGFEIEKK